MIIFSLFCFLEYSNFVCQVSHVGVYLLLYEIQLLLEPLKLVIDLFGGLDAIHLIEEKVCAILLVISAWLNLVAEKPY